MIMKLLYKCRYCNKEYSRPCGLAIHERICLKNSNRKPLVNNGNGWKFVKNKRAPFGTWKCIDCGKIFETRSKLKEHRKLIHDTTTRKYEIIDGKRRLTQGSVAWNTGLTKETSKSIAKGAETYKKHIEDGTIIPSQLGKPLSKDHKEHISKGMVKAHAEGKAHNIGESRWNNEHSYPEKWLIKVLENEFGMKENIDYKTELSFGRYALDFAWINEKFCIEIDGEQHERFEKYKLRDNKKDELLKQNNWQEIRIKWKDCFNNPKFYIELIRNKFKELNLIKE